MAEDKGGANFIDEDLLKAYARKIVAQSLIYLACMTYNGKCMLNVENLQQLSYAERC